jgi:hypothetical protein
MKIQTVFCAFALVSAVSMLAMDGDEQLATDLSALKVSSESKVDAWDALGTAQKKEVKSMLVKWVGKYNANQKKYDKPCLTHTESQEVIKRAYLDIKANIRHDGDTLPTLPSEQAERETVERQYYYEGFLHGRIHEVKNAGAISRVPRDQQTGAVSDSEDEVEKN